MYTGSLTPSLFTRLAALAATDAFIPRTRLGMSASLASCDMTSDSANTVQVELMLMVPSAFASRSLRSATPTSSILAITSRKRPVPAAHLSFIRKFSSLPLSPMLITLASCPPMSRSVLAWGYMVCTPSVCAESSLITKSAASKLLRP